MKSFTASNFKGECIIDPDFENTLSKMNEIAVNHEIIVIVISSFRKDTVVKNAIVKPASHSNHMVGHAIDCNLMYRKQYFNSREMQNDIGADHDFIKECETNGVRWGGDFTAKDPVHFDDGLNIHNPDLWLKKYNAIHNA